MAEYRTIKMTFWHDPYIEDLEAKVKLLYIYLFTSPYTNNLGVVKVTKRKIAFETGLSGADIEKYLADFVAHRKVVMDDKDNCILLINFIKNQTSTSPKIIEGLKKLTISMRSAAMVKALCIRYPALFDIADAEDDTLCIPYADGMHTLYIPSGEIGSWKGEEGKGKMEDGSGKAPRTRKDTPSHSDPSAEKTKFGENGNVLLTPAEHKNLCQKFTPEITEKAIAFLDLHIGAKGKDEYKSHNLAMQKWVFDAVNEREAKKARASPPLQSRDGPSRNGNAYNDGRERSYGQSDFGALSGGGNT